MRGADGPGAPALRRPARRAGAAHRVAAEQLRALARKVDDLRFATGSGVVSGLVAGARKVLGRSAPLDGRVAGLERAVDGAARASRRRRRGAGRRGLPSRGRPAAAVRRAHRRRPGRGDRLGQVLDVQRADRARPGRRRRTPSDDVVRHRLPVGRRPAPTSCSTGWRSRSATGSSRDSLLDTREARQARWTAWCCWTCPTTTRPRSPTTSRWSG